VDFVVRYRFPVLELLAVEDQVLRAFPDAHLVVDLLLGAFDRASEGSTSSVICLPVTLATSIFLESEATPEPRSPAEPEPSAASDASATSAAPVAIAA